jgi:hypothetical protein
MSTYLSAEIPHVEAERAAVVGSGALAGDDPRRCPVCQGPMPEGKSSACSDRCRAEKSRRTRGAKQNERDARLRALAEAILRELDDFPK